MTDAPDQPVPPAPPQFPTAPPTVPDGQPLPPLAPSAPPPPVPPAEALPTYAPSPPPARGRRGKVVAVAAAVVVALLAGAFAVNALTSSSGGASSPDAAMKKLFDAIANEDALGVLDTLEPGERDLLLPTIKNTKDQLVRLGLAKDVDLGKVPGFDIDVTGLETKSTDLREGVARVDVTGGHISFSTRPDAVPVGDVLHDLIEATGNDAAVPDASNESGLGGGPNDYAIAVKRGGGWYVSVLTTFAEYARTDAGLEPPDPQAAIAPQGADSPQEAVTAFLDAAGRLDLKSLIAHLPPGEAGVLQLYAPLFLDDAQRSVDEFRDETGFGIEFKDLDLSTADGDLGTIVKINGGTFEFSFQDGSLRLEVKDGCVSFDGTGAASDVISQLSDQFGVGTRVCQDELQSTLSDQFAGAGESAPYRAFAEIGERLQNANLGLLAVQDGGRWYVSPTRTVLETVLQLLAAVDKTDLQRGGFLYDLVAGG